MALSRTLYVFVALLTSLAAAEANLWFSANKFLIRGSTLESTSSTSLLKNDQEDEEFPKFTSKQGTISRALSEDDEEEEHHNESKPWGTVFGATLIVNLATLAGVIFLVPCFNPTKATQVRVLDIIIPAFAAGALIATVVFLTVPEGLANIQQSLMEEEEEEHHDEEEEEHDHLRFLRFLEGEEDPDEHEEHGFEITPGASWRFGACILGGFLIPVLLGAIFPHVHSEDVAEVTTADEEKPKDENFEEADKTGAVEATEVATPLNISLALSILIGDAFHNFCDGVFIGVAFKNCDASIAWTIMAVTLYHEVAQEIADYFLLTRHAGFSKFKALLANFLAGLSVILGGLIVVATDLSDLSIGVLLSLSSGVYLYIAACECLSRVARVVSSPKDSLLLILMFAVGAIPVGLTLLNHSHCEAGHEEEGHENH